MSGLLAGVMAVMMGVFPIVPPEHVHESEEAGRLQVVIHRHLPDHGILEHHSDHHPSGIDHDDGPVLTLSAIYNVPAAFVIVGPSQSVVATVESQEPRRLERSSNDPDILIHGPPRAPTGLRAPPVSPAT